MYTYRSSRLVLQLVASALAVGAMDAVDAGMITILDPGFENRQITSQFSNFNTSDPWNTDGFSAGSGILNPSAGNSLFPGLSASGGNQFGAGINTSFSQTLSVAFDPSFSYRLDFDVAPSTGNADGSGFFAQLLTVDGGILKETEEFFTVPLGTLWIRKSVVFDPIQDSFGPGHAGSLLRIRFGGFHIASIDDSAGFDNITLHSSAAVPEPSSTLMSLPLLAAIVLGGRKRRVCRLQRREETLPENQR